MGIGFAACIGVLAAGWILGDDPSAWKAGKDDEKILKYIGGELGVEFPADGCRVVTFGAESASFHGDGSTYGKIQLDEEACKTAAAKAAEMERFAVDAADNGVLWHKGETKGTSGSMRRVSYLQAGYEIPKVKQGYYFFKDRNDDPDFAAELGYSPNFTAGVLDTEERMLYYGKFDM